MSVRWIISLGIVGMIASVSIGTGMTVAMQPPVDVEERGELTPPEDGVAVSDSREGFSSYSHGSGEGMNGSCTVDQATELNTSVQFLEVIQQCAPVTNSTPPAAAGVTTATRFETLTPGTASVARYPPQATSVETALITDAHATVFGVHPSTRVERANESVLVLTPRGTVRALVDYRLRAGVLNTTRVRSHGVETVRLRHDERVVAEQSVSTQTPQINYTGLPVGPARLTLEADIRIVHNTTADGNTSGTEFETVVVRDELRVIVTEVSTDTVALSRVTDATGETVLAIGHPFWRAIAVTATPTNRTRTAPVTDQDDASKGNITVQVRNNWQFYPAEDEGWTNLSTATAAGVVRTSNASPPVFVHAVRTGRASVTEATSPRERSTATESGIDGAQPPVSITRIHTDTSGSEHSQGTSWVTVRMPETHSPAQVSVSGLVRDEHVRIDLSDIPASQRHEPTLSVALQEQSATRAAIVISLRANATNEPIVVRAGSHATVTTNPRRPTLFVNGQSVATDSTGQAVVPITEYGTYEVVFDPGPLHPTRTEALYTATAERVTWHPLSTASGWLAFLSQLLAWALSGLVVLYAGRQLGRFLHRREQL